MKLNWVEIKRKTWHILWGIFFYLLISLTSPIIYQSLMGALLIAGVIVFYLIRKKIKLGFVEFLINQLGRENEGIEACFYFVTGIFLSSFFFSPQIVALSALALGVCDGFATIIGIHFGKNNKIYKNKTFAGTSAFFISCFILVYISGYGKMAALIVSSALAAIELFTGINDNLMIPPAFSIILKIFG